MDIRNASYQTLRNMCSSTARSSKTADDLTISQEKLTSIFPRSEKKKNEVVFFKKVTFLKTELHLCFLLFSLLEPLMQRNLNANFLVRL